MVFDCQRGLEMTTKLDKNVREIIAHHGGTVV